MSRGSTRLEAIPMGPASRPGPGSRATDAPSGVAIVEIIEMKSSLGIAHAPGVVAVLDSFPATDSQAFVGRGVRLFSPAGELTAHAKVEAVRDHGPTISLFFR